MTVVVAYSSSTPRHDADFARKLSELAAVAGAAFCWPVAAASAGAANCSKEIGLLSGPIGTPFDPL